MRERERERFREIKRKGVKNSKERRYSEREREREREALSLSLNMSTNSISLSFHLFSFISFKILLCSSLGFSLYLISYFSLHFNLPFFSPLSLSVCPPPPSPLFDLPPSISVLSIFSLSLSTVQHGFLEFITEIGCFRVCGVRMLKSK